MEEAEVIRFPDMLKRTSKPVRTRRRQVWRFLRHHWVTFYRFHRYMGKPPKVYYIINVGTGVKTRQERQVIRALNARFNMRRIDRMVIYNMQSLGYGEELDQAIYEFEAVLKGLVGYRYMATFYIVWPTRNVRWNEFSHSVSLWGTMIPVDELLEMPLPPLPR